MGKKEENNIIADNGIRIKGDLSTFKLHLQNSTSLGSADKKNEHTKLKGDESNKKTKSYPTVSIKEKKRSKKEKQKVTRKKVKPQGKRESESEKRRKTAAQRRIEEFHKRMAKSMPSLHSSFDIMQKKDWILDWNCVLFKNEYMVIYPQSTSTVKFKPLKTYTFGLLESYNYLKKYLNERLPPVRCQIVGQELTIVDEINFNEALQQFAIAARQGVIKVKRNSMNGNTSPSPMSFSQALSRAKQMKPEEFKKYKSKYIDFLVELQSREYKVIPCVERLAHANSDNTEYAFMFSIECSSGKILIVHENVNPDRSTLIFLVKKNDFNKSIREIYDFLQSAEINKRSSLRDRSIEIRNTGVLSYRSINHDDINSWKQTISMYKRYR